MSVNLEKLEEMLLRDDTPRFQKQRGSVAKESLVRASGGDYDAINSLLEEDIALDDRLFAPVEKKRVIAGNESVRVMRKVQRPLQAKECEGAAVDVNSPIPSPVRKKAQESSENSGKTFIYRNAEICKCNSSDRPWMISGFGESYSTAEDAMNGVDEWIDEQGIDFTGSVSSEEACAAESVTEESKMIGTTGETGGKPKNMINFKSQNNGFETDVSKDVGDAKALSEKETIKAAGESVATEDVVEPSEDSVFPSELNFDNEAFAELFGLNPDEVSIEYVPEEENESEHLEVRFTDDSGEVLLKILDNGTVEETVNAEVKETPRFSASITQDDEGVYQLLISPEGENVSGDVTKSEEDSVNNSEGDTNSKDEDGTDRTDEFVEGTGLKLDSEYSASHGMKAEKNAADKIKDPTELLN